MIILKVIKQLFINNIMLDIFLPCDFQTTNICGIVGSKNPVSSGVGGLTSPDGL